MFISTVVCLVPVVDCSEAVGVVEMTEVTLTSFVPLKLKLHYPRTRLKKKLALAHLPRGVSKLLGRVLLNFAFIKGTRPLTSAVKIKFPSLQG